MIKQLLPMGFLTATALLLITACSEQGSDQAANAEVASNQPALKLYTLDCGTIAVSDLDVFASSGAYAGLKGDLTNTCYLIRHPQGDLLWDLGLPTALAGTGPQTNGVFTMTMQQTLTTQLSDLGIAPDDIDFMAISHSHFDHTGQADQFPNSQWLVNNNEFEHMYATKESSAQNAAFTTISKTTYSGNNDVFGDGSVIILSSPGHTPGHSVLQVNLPQTGPMLLTGDLYHRTESRASKYVPRFNTDEPQTRVSMAAFEALATELGARVIIQHEPADVATLPKPPLFLD